MRSKENLGWTGVKKSKPSGTVWRISRRLTCMTFVYVIDLHTIVSCFSTFVFLWSHSAFQNFCSLIFGFHTTQASCVYNGFTINFRLAVKFSTCFNYNCQFTIDRFQHLPNPGFNLNGRYNSTEVISWYYTILYSVSINDCPTAVGVESSHKFCMYRQPRNVRQHWSCANSYFSKYGKSRTANNFWKQNLNFQTNSCFTLYRMSQKYRLSLEVHHLEMW
jgi:hypothetical protein